MHNIRDVLCTAWGCKRLISNYSLILCSAFNMEHNALFALITIYAELLYVSLIFCANKATLKSLVSFSGTMLFNLPGARILSPSVKPIISLILARQACSINMKTGAISYVNIFVLAAAVNHSPARETTSRPVDN